MTKHILILLIVASSFNSKCQNFEEEEGLVSRYRPGLLWFYTGFKPYDEEEKLRKYDRLIFDITYSDWYGGRDYFQSPWNSIGFNAALMFDVILSKQSTVAFGWGIGYSHFGNATNKQFTRDFDEKATYMSDFPEGQEPLRNKFGANYIEIPLDLRFRTKGFKHFKVMIGGKIGYQINSFTKTAERIDGQTYKSKLYNFADANRLRYGATIRIGIRNWAIYGAYYFSPLFTNSKSVQLTPFTAGISISLF
jgi:hypothetical protein